MPCRGRGVEWGAPAASIAVSLCLHGCRHMFFCSVVSFCIVKAGFVAPVDGMTFDVYKVGLRECPRVV